MLLTEKLKGFLVENCGVSKDAMDEDFRAAAGKALADPEKSGLTIEKYQELTAPAEKDSANEFLKAQQETIALLKSTIEVLKSDKAGTDGASAMSPESDEIAPPVAADKATEVAAAPVSEAAKAEFTPTELQKAIIGGTEDSNMRQAIDVHVKEAADRYPTERKSMHYPEKTHKGNQHVKSGQRVMDMGREMNHASQQDKALAGVWAKFQLLSVSARFAGSAQRAYDMLNEHEKELFCYLATHSEWDISKDGKQGTRIGYPGGYKQLIDDATSGGLEAAPIVFDDQVIEAPLLFGELFPLVNTVPIDRGRRIEGVATGRVTGGWGGVDDTPVTLFVTTTYVSAFDTTIFRWEGAILIGLDFLSDTPIDFGAHITRQYGERLLEDLDDVIATGDGTTQPEGVINATGVSTIAFGATTSIGNYESLRFGVAKPEHKGPIANTAVFCGTETSYQRVRALPVGATDARRLFGIDHFGPNAGGYTIDGGSYRINESLTNAQIFYAVLGRYRMYRRKGFTVRTSTEGTTLIRANELLIVVMARYGGQLERGAAAAITTTAPV